MKIAIPVLLMLVVSGCSFFQKGEMDDYVPITTPGGYFIRFHDQGSVKLHGTAKIGTLFDVAVGKAVERLSRYGVSEADTKKAIRATIIHCIDHFGYETYASETGWASGGYDQRTRLLSLEFYTMRRLPVADPYPEDSPTWTRMPSPTDPKFKVCGVLDPTDPFAALKHEGGHVHFQDPMFEHWPKGDPRYR